MGNSSWPLRMMAKPSPAGDQSAGVPARASEPGDPPSTSSRGAPPASDTSATTGPESRERRIASIPFSDTEARFALGSGSAVDSVLSRRVVKSCTGRPCQAAA